LQSFALRSRRPGGGWLLHGSILFENSLIGVDIPVDADGTLTMTNEKLLSAEVPAFEEPVRA
jgi:hypothetical protein